MNRTRAFTGLILGCMMAAMGWWLPVGVAHGEIAGLKRVSATATLTVLAGTVQHVSGGSTSPKPATSGMNLHVGERVLTGPKSTALITFLNGSTLTVQPESDIAVKRVDIGKKSSKVNVHINTGTVWARVVRLLDPESGLSLESNTATATVHDGLIGGRQNADGTFSCWTRTQGMMVTDKSGRTVVVLPGEMVIVKEGQELVPHDFKVNLSALGVSAPAGFLPMVVMPDQSRVAGFVAPDLEVNQVFGSLTRAAADGTHEVEVPAGTHGPYVIVIDALQDGPAIIKVRGTFKGEPVYHLDLAIVMRKGEPVKAEITQAIEEATAGEPKTAEVTSGTVTPWRPVIGTLPGTILISPEELEGSAGR